MTSRIQFIIIFYIIDNIVLDQTIKHDKHYNHTLEQMYIQKLLDIFIWQDSEWYEGEKNMLNDNIYENGKNLSKITQFM